MSCMNTVPSPSGGISTIRAYPSAGGTTPDVQCARRSARTQAVRIGAAGVGSRCSPAQPLQPTDVATAIAAGSVAIPTPFSLETIVGTTRPIKLHQPTNVRPPMVAATHVFRRDASVRATPLTLLLGGLRG